MEVDKQKSTGNVEDRGATGEMTSMPSTTSQATDVNTSQTPWHPSFNKSASSPANMHTLAFHHHGIRRQQSIKEKLQLGTSRFFGLPSPDKEDASPRVLSIGDAEEEKWQQRRFRHLNKLGRIKDDAVARQMRKEMRVGIDALPELTAGLDMSPSPMSCAGIEMCIVPPLSRALSTDARMMPLGKTRPIERKENMLRIFLDTLSSVVEGSAWRKSDRSGRRASIGQAKDGLSSKSFSFAYQPPGGKYTSLREKNAVPGSSSRQYCSFPYKRPERAEEADGKLAPNERVADIVASVLISPPHQAAVPTAASLLTPGPPRHPLLPGEDSYHRERPSTSTSSPVKSVQLEPMVPQRPEFYSLRRPSHPLQPIAITPAAVAPTERVALKDAIVDPQRENEVLTTVESSQPLGCYEWCRRFLTLRWIGGNDEDSARLKSFLKLRYSLHRGDVQQKRVATRRAPTRRRRMLCWGKMKRNLSPTLQRYLEDEAYDYRPFFTIWITFVQVLVMVFMLLNYGVDTHFRHLFGVVERSGDVTAPYRSTVHIVVYEQNNVWMGPSFADLILVGAKYTPCMRRDERIYKQITDERAKEALDTGCCIGSYGCMQTSECPKQFATLVKWTNNSVGSQRARVVCGQDARYCLKPRSIHPQEWPPADISKWPICEKNEADEKIPRKRAKHMHCEITARPCCIQSHGQCRITSRDYCTFVRGTFHPEATLCSQVSCMSDVCGMSSFLRTDWPDQIYRLITPLFIHAGLIRLLFTMLIQLSFMWRFEVMIGWLRLSIIYFTSGIAGYLASAAFVPYMPEVGPAGSQGGVLGAMIINLLYNWDYLLKPRMALLKHLGIVLFGFLTGLLPWVDNWAQSVGFVIGSLLAVALIPFIRPNNKRVVVVAASLGMTALLFLVLCAIFFVFPNINHPIFELLNCPFNGRICDHQGLKLRSWLPI